MENYLNTQNLRPFKIDIYGLQDNYIGVLQSYNDDFIGRVVEPKVSLSHDGTFNFTCSIPKYYIDEATNSKIVNPRWEDVLNGILAENTRVLKVFIQFNDEIRVFPFIIDTIVDKRDKNYSVFKEVTANGLAFAELGKVGYKIELSKTILEKEYEKDDTITPTIQYWLDKVFPNKKEDGKIVKWLTSWCYEIRMDWSGYSGNLDNTKIYDDISISSWKEENGQLIPSGHTERKEKARIMDCVNSNKYNITQDLAEKFGVFCYYEYKTDAAGNFIKEYEDENGNLWTGRKVIFYNNAIKLSKPFFVNYQHNLNTISRTSDTTELYTKMYVQPQESSIMENGYITIADATANPLKDDFILNFDYLDSINSLTEYQKEFIAQYKVELRKKNSALEELSPQINTLVVDINNQKAEIAGIEKNIQSAEEQLEHYRVLAENEVTNTPVEKNQNNPCTIIFVTEGNVAKAAIHLEGVVASSITGYSNPEYTKVLFSNNEDSEQDNLEIVSTLFEPEETDNNYYILLDEYGYAVSVFCRPGLINDNGALAYLKLLFSPSNKYNVIISSLSSSRENNIERKKAQESILKNNESLLESKNDKFNTILKEKEELNSKLERVLGVALREGYWTPESYEDVQQTNQVNEAPITWELEAFEGEQLPSYKDLEGAGDQIKDRYYYYLPINNNILENANREQLNALEFIFQKDYIYTIQENNKDAFKAENKYHFTYDSVKYYFILPEDLSTGDTIKIAKNLDKITVTVKEKQIIPTTTPIEAATNINSLFEGQMGDYILYNKAGFVYSWISKNKTEGTFEPLPAALIINTDFNPEDYVRVLYSFEGEQAIFSYGAMDTSIQGGGVVEENQEGPFMLVYPRIILQEQNINYFSDLLKITLWSGEEYNSDSEENIVLEKYLDYTVLLRGGRPHITLKATASNSVDDIINNKYRVSYPISRANETLYIDAKEVAKENSMPKYSYEISVSNLPNEINNVEIGQLAYINDYSLGVNSATGYVSELTYNLDSPKDDEIKIANYKTKFEDLFSTIAATNEAMKTNKATYDMVAGNFEPNGNISGSVLQTAINNNDLYFNYSNTGVEINPASGITLTNAKPYVNGVYGQVALQGGGIYLSNSINPQTGERIWNTGITPYGINASLINAGQINTNLIRIYSDDQMAFQWNGDGIYAYRLLETGKPTVNEYVRYSKDGLHYTKHIGENGTPINLVSLDWNGLTLKNHKNQKTLQLDAETGDLTLSGNMQSYNYVGGALGSGWRIDQNGRAEFNDVSVRGTISASVFEYDETTAVGGRMYISPTLIILPDVDKPLKIEKTSEAATYGVRFYMKTPLSNDTNMCGRAWKEGDLIGINGVIINRENTALRYELKNLRATITNLNTDGYLILTTENTVLDNNSYIFYKEDGTTIKIGDIIDLFKNNQYISQESINLIFLGQKDQKNGIMTQEGILLDSMGSGGPYIDIYGPEANKSELIEENNNTFSGPRVRLGDLTELAAIDYISELYPGISGYGLYADNVWLKGQIYATGGQIGSLTIENFEETIKQTQTNNNTITIDIISPTNFAYKKDSFPVLKTIVMLGGKQIKTPNELPDGITDFQFGYQWSPVDEEAWSNFSWGLKNWDETNLDNTYQLTTSPENRRYRAIAIYKKNDEWQEEIYSSVYNYIEVSDGEPGKTGDPGPAGTTYKILPSVSSITRDLLKIIPTTINFQLLKDGVAQQIISSEEIGSYYLIIKHNSNNGDNAITSGFTNDGTSLILDLANYSYNGGNKGVNTLFVSAYKKGENGISELVDFITIPFTIGEALNELSKVDKGKVFIDGGKIYAGSIITDALASKVITTDKIDANAITAEKIASNFDLEIGSGRSINITANGAFTIDSENFNIDENGNVSIAGNVTAESGEIGGWAIGEKRLYSSAENKGGNATDENTVFFIGMDANPEYHYAFWAGNTSIDVDGSTDIDTNTCPFRVTKSGHLYADAGAIGGWTLEKDSLYSGNEENYVALNSTTSEYAIWAGNRDTEAAPFSVTKKGALKSTSGEIGGWMIDESSLHSIVENNEAANNYVYLHSEGLEEGGNVEECIFQYGYSTNPDDTTPTEWKTWDTFKMEIEDLYNSEENIWLSTRRIITYETGKQKVELPELLYQYVKQNDNRMSSEITILYRATNSTSTPSNYSWQTVPPTLSKNTRFLWQKGSYTIANSNGTVTKTITTSPVIISSFEKNFYAIWAGGETGQSSPFAVTQDGKVYATNLIIRTLQEGSTTQYTEKNIMDYPLWAIWSAYSGRVTNLESTTSNGQVTLTLTTGSGTHSVTFNKAVTGELVATSGGRGEFNISFKATDIEEPLATGTVSLELSGEKDQSSIAALFNGSTYASYELDSFYREAFTDALNGLTLSGSWDGSGTYTATASNSTTGFSESIHTKIGLTAAGSGADNFSVYGTADGVNQVSGYVSGALNRASKTVTLSFQGTPYGQVSVSGVYDDGHAAGYAAGYAAGGKENQEAYENGVTDGKDAAASSLYLSPEDNITLGYGNKQTVTAYVQGGLSGLVSKSVTITAPSDNYSNGYNDGRPIGIEEAGYSGGYFSVRVNKGDGSSQTYTLSGQSAFEEGQEYGYNNVTITRINLSINGNTVNATATASNNQTAENSISVQDVYDEGYAAGLEAGKAAMGLSRNGNTITVTESGTKSITASPYLAGTHSYTESAATQLSSSIWTNYSPSSHTDTRYAAISWS